MANNSSNKSSSSSSSSSKSSSKRSNVWGLNKISMYTIVAVAFLYAVSMVLALAGVSLKVVAVLQALATAIMIIIVSILAWRYVKAKPMVWKVLYVICLLLVIAGVIVPLIK